jgi:hypothetical protein
MLGGGGANVTSLYCLFTVIRNAVLFKNTVCTTSMKIPHAFPSPVTQWTTSTLLQAACFRLNWTSCIFSYSLFMWGLVCDRSPKLLALQWQTKLLTMVQNRIISKLWVWFKCMDASCSLSQIRVHHWNPLQWHNLHPILAMTWKSSLS